ncbi:AAA family ATPase, partial [Mycobacterium tuberculosis]|nr:AAA family ATPase [Mycobacterium tuberculosis]
TVHGAALSGIASENLEGGSGIQSRTLASLEYQWGQGREQLGPRDVLVIDEAGMIGTRQMERVLAHAEQAGAKVVMVGDPEQLQAIEAGASF